MSLSLSLAKSTHVRILLERFVTARKQSCGKIVFSQMYDVASGVGGEGLHPSGLQMDAPPTGSMHPPSQKTDGKPAGGTHPTGMHTCLQIKSTEVIFWQEKKQNISTTRHKAAGR